MEVRRGNDRLPFALALEQEEVRCREALPLQHRIFSYVDRGFYSAQLRRFWRFFGREQVLVLRQEELLESPKTCMDKIWQHLAFHQFRRSRLSRHNDTTNLLCPTAAVNTSKRSFGKRSDN